MHHQFGVIKKSKIHSKKIAGFSEKESTVKYTIYHKFGIQIEASRDHYLSVGTVQCVIMARVRYLNTYTILTNFTKYLQVENSDYVHFFESGIDMKICSQLKHPLTNGK